MLQTKTKVVSKAETLSNKSVQLFIQSRLKVLSGNWQWDMQSDTVFCSDVMFLLPTAFEGTKGIVHPDDLPQIKTALSNFAEGASHPLTFRMITTYGEVKTLTGENLTVTTADELVAPEAVLTAEEDKNKQLQKAHEKLFIQTEITRYAERILQAGTWYYNTATYDAWYSDAVFRMYGLPPQSLNAHLNTFVSFIHPDDKEAVTKAFARAFTNTTPLHIEYRIITADGKEKLVLQITRWIYNAKGNLILTGVIQSKAEQAELEQQLKQRKEELHFQQELLLQNEESAGTAFWHINLLTKKTVYSNNFYRLFGLKPQSVLPLFNVFINYVHPDDRERVAETYQKIWYEHTAMLMEYRIVRPDGNIRHLMQKGKVVTGAEGDLLMAGTIQDITVYKLAEEKMAQLNHELFVTTNINQQTEEITGSCSWQWNMQTGKITGTDNLYRFYSLKPQSVPLSQKFLLSIVHRDDQKTFEQALRALVAGEPVPANEFKVIRKGKVGRIKVAFKLLEQNTDTKIAIVTLLDANANFDLEEQMEKHQQYYNLLTNTIQDKVLLTDANNNIVFWSKKCEEGFGWKKEEVLNKNFFDVFPSLKTESFLRNIQQVNQGETVSLSYHNLPQLKGYHHITMSPLTDKENGVNGIMYVLHNIEKELELQLGLSVRLNFIESLIDATVDRIIVMDRNMNYLYWNKQCEEYYGLNKEEVIGKNILDLFPGSNLFDANFNHFRKALKGETVYIPATTSMDNAPYQETYLIPIKDELNEVNAVLWVLHDLTKEYQLQKQQKKADNILNALNDAYMELDANFNFVYINAKAEALLGKGKEELLNKPIADVLTERGNSPLYQAIIKAWNEKVAAKGEFLSIIPNKAIETSIIPNADGILLILQSGSTDQ